MIPLMVDAEIRVEYATKISFHRHITFARSRRSKHDARVTGAAADNMQSARSSHRGFIVLRAAARVVLCG